VPHTRFLLFFLVACAWAESNIPVTACSSITQEQVQNALGRTVGKGVETNGPAQSECDFRGPNGLVTITLHRLAEPVLLDRQQADLRAAFPGASFQPLTLEASRGFAMILPEAGIQLHLPAEPRQYLIVTVLGFGSGATTRTAAEWIAKAVLARIAAPLGRATRDVSE